MGLAVHHPPWLTKQSSTSRSTEGFLNAYSCYTMNPIPKSISRLPKRESIRLCLGLGSMAFLIESVARRGGGARFPTFSLMAK